MPKIRRSALISPLGFVALAIALGGCGGDRNDKGLSSKEYAAAVTRICTSNARALQRLLATGGGDFLARKGDEFLEVANGNIGKLKNLQPPTELDSKAHRLIVDAEATRDRLVALIAVAKKHPGTVDLGNTALLDARRRMIQAASDVGAVC